MVVAVEIAISTPGPGLNAAASETDKNNSQVETVIANSKKNPSQQYATPCGRLQAPLKLSILSIVARQFWLKCAGICFNDGAVQKTTDR
jgi:hypothetical protein